MQLTTRGTTSKIKGGGFPKELHKKKGKKGEKIFSFHYKTLYMIWLL